MPVAVDLNNLPPFPKRIPEKLRTIREHFKLTPDEIAPMVGARTGAEILAYENDEDDLLVTVLWNYSKIVGCSIDQILYDNLEITFRDLQAI
jgi:DNA-binding XRE family transcriptional regulator